MASAISTDISHHVSIFMLINKPQIPTKCQATITFKIQKITNTTLDIYGTSLGAVDWNPVHSLTDANLAYKKFLGIIKPL